MSTDKSIYRHLLRVVKATLLRERDKVKVNVVVVRCDFSLVTTVSTLSDISTIIQLKYAKLFLVCCKTARFEQRMKLNEEWQTEIFTSTLMWSHTRLFSGWWKVKALLETEMSGSSSLLNCHCFLLKNPWTAGWYGPSSIPPALVIHYG